MKINKVQRENMNRLRNSKYLEFYEDSGLHYYGTYGGFIKEWDRKAIEKLIGEQIAPDITSLTDSLAALGLVVDGKEPAITAGNTTQYWRGDKTWQTLDKSAVGLSNVLNVTQEPAITAGATAQYWRGDKSWQDLTSAVYASALSGFSAGANSTVADGDSISQWLAKVQGQINARPYGLAANTYMTYYTGANTISGNSNFTYDSSTNKLAFASNSSGGSAITIEVGTSGADMRARWLTFTNYNGKYGGMSMNSVTGIHSVIAGYNYRHNATGSGFNRYLTTEAAAYTNWGRSGTDYIIQSQILSTAGAITANHYMDNLQLSYGSNGASIGTPFSGSPGGIGQGFSISGSTGPGIALVSSVPSHAQTLHTGLGSAGAFVEYINRTQAGSTFSGYLRYIVVSSSTYPTDGYRVHYGASSGAVARHHFFAADSITSARMVLAATNLLGTKGVFVHNDGKAIFTGANGSHTTPTAGVQIRDSFIIDPGGTKTFEVSTDNKISFFNGVPVPRQAAIVAADMTAFTTADATIHDNMRNRINAIEAILKAYNLEA